MVAQVIVVDSSVWIAFFKRDPTPPVSTFKAIADPSEILVADLVLLEVLQGARDERHAGILEAGLRTFQIVTTMSETLAVAAARHYRSLRGLGFTIPKTPDLILATYCIAEGIQLLHDDRDFIPFEKHLGLRCV